MDVASIGVGTRWAEVIEETLRSCDVAIILIGKRWLEIGQGGVRRIDQPQDPTRLEIATALRLNLRIVPLLVLGAAVPERSDLPADVAAITEWQALRVDDDDFDHDAARLIRALEHQLGDHEAPPQLDDASQKQDEELQLAAGAEPVIGQPEVTRRRSGYFGLSLGRLRVWVTIGVAAVAIIVVQAAGFLPGSRSPTSTVASSPIGARGGADDPGGSAKPAPPEESPGSGQATSSGGPGVSTSKPSVPVDSKRAVGAEPSNPPPKAAAPRIAGDYALVSYSERGSVLPLTGAMRLTAMHSGRYQFDTFVKNPQMPGRSLQYHGVLLGGGATWTVTTIRTNDPNTLVATPIVTDVKFDGSTLAMANDYGQAAVWRKR
jgi:hypothetical protein